MEGARGPEVAAPILAALEAATADPQGASVDAMETPLEVVPVPAHDEQPEIAPVATAVAIAEPESMQSPVGRLLAPPAAAALAEALSQADGGSMAPSLSLEVVAVAADVTGEGTGSGKKKRRAAAIANEAADLTPEEALQKAEEEGLTLIGAHTQTGFLYVYLWNSGGAAKKEGGEAPQPKLTGKAPRVFQLQPQKGTSMGYYRSAEGAALAYARSIGADAARQKAAKVKAQPRSQSGASSLLAALGNVGDEEALIMAEAEGLTLVRSVRSKSGYKHVATMKLTSRPFRLNAQNGVTHVEGNFASAAAAALAHARQIGVQASAAEAASEQARGEALELAPGGSGGAKVKLVPHGQQAAGGGRSKATLTLPITCVAEGVEGGGEGVGAVEGGEGSVGLGEGGGGGEGASDVGGQHPVVAAEIVGPIEGGDAASGLYRRDDVAVLTSSPAVATTTVPGGNGGGVMTVPIGDVQMLSGEASLRLAASEGLAEKVELLRSSTNKSGYKNVTHHCDTEKHKTSKKSRPFQLTRHIEKSRRAASLGYFASAEAAALVQARIMRAEEQAAQSATGEHGGSGHVATASVTHAIVEELDDGEEGAGGEDGDHGGQKRKRKLSNPGGGYTCRRCGQPKKGHTCPNPRPKGASGGPDGDDDDLPPTAIEGAPMEVVPLGQPIGAPVGHVAMEANVAAGHHVATGPDPSALLPAPLPPSNAMLAPVLG